MLTYHLASSSPELFKLKVKLKISTRTIQSVFLTRGLVLIFLVFSKRHVTSPGPVTVA